MRFGGVCVQWSRRSAQEPDKWVYFERDSRKKNKKKELFKRRTDFFLSSVHASGGCRSDGCGGGDGDSRSFRATDSLQGQDKDWTRTME